MNKKLFTILAFLFFASFLYYCFYRYDLLNQELASTRESLLSSNSDLRSKIGNLEIELKKSQEENSILTESLFLEKNKNSDFERQINSIQESVGIVEKLHNTDKELLQKYSKVYFLNENYIPASLSIIDPKYLYNEKQETKIHSQVLPFLNDLLDDAESNGAQLQIVSAYRSFYDQTSLKTNYKVLYGSGANKFSADQGYSEHQLGTAVDFNVPDLYAPFYKFETTESYQWLLDNAHKYGFVLSYPKGNAYYQFEPWHWRYVGIKLAERLHYDNLYFYDLDQRSIDSYLIYLF